MTADSAQAQWDESIPRYAQQTSSGPISISRRTSAGTYPAATYELLTPAELRSELLAVRITRRAADLFIASLGLIVLVPLMLGVLVANKFDSSGPLLFRQLRVGRDDTVFRMIKFRTMFTDAEQRLHELEVHNESVGGVLFKIKADPRVTRVGRHLRRFNLDEIPQLFTVLRGDMSIVGPRPLPLRDSELLATLHPLEYQLRLTVRPGITGEWQVRRNVGSSDYGHMLELDLAYLHSRSFRHDAFLAAKTVLVLMKAIFVR